MGNCGNGVVVAEGGWWWSEVGGGGGLGKKKEKVRDVISTFLGAILSTFGAMNKSFEFFVTKIKSKWYQNRVLCYQLYFGIKKFSYLVEF